MHSIGAAGVSGKINHIENTNALTAAVQNFCFRIYWWSGMRTPRCRCYPMQKYWGLTVICVPDFRGCCSCTAFCCRYGLVTPSFARVRSFQLIFEPWTPFVCWLRWAELTVAIWYKIATWNETFTLSFSTSIFHEKQRFEQLLSARCKLEGSNLQLLLQRGRSIPRRATTLKAADWTIAEPSVWPKPND